MGKPPNYSLMKLKILENSTRNIIKSIIMLNQLSQKTPILNLFLTGAWTMPAGGVSTVLYGGDTCNALVDKYLKKKSKILNN